MLAKKGNRKKSPHNLASSEIMKLSRAFPWFIFLSIGKLFVWLYSSKPNWLKCLKKPARWGLDFEKSDISSQDY
jgi:hypothetical protein